MKLNTNGNSIIRKMNLSYKIRSINSHRTPLLITVVHLRKKNGSQDIEENHAGGLKLLGYQFLPFERGCPTAYFGIIYNFVQTVNDDFCLFSR